MPEVMKKKPLYKHKKGGDLFAIETDEAGNVLSTSGLLLTEDLNPEADRTRIRAIQGVTGRTLNRAKKMLDVRSFKKEESWF